MGEPLAQDQTEDAETAARRAEIRERFRAAMARGRAVTREQREAEMQEVLRLAAARRRSVA